MACIITVVKTKFYTFKNCINILIMGIYPAHSLAEAPQLLDVHHLCTPQEKDQSSDKKEHLIRVKKITTEEHHVLL